MVELDLIKDRARAEGVSPSLILKEQIHMLILEHLFREGAFSDLVFQGGTALRVAYQGVRYSEDLDFVLNLGNSQFFGEIGDILSTLPSFLEKFILFAQRIRLKAQKQTPFLQRFSLVVEGESLQAQDRTNIEIVNVPSYENEVVLVRHDRLPLNPAIRVERPREILSDKYCAFGSREYVKGRDLWDIYFLRDSMKVSFDREAKAMVLKKVKDYHEELPAFLSGFKKNLSVLAERGLEILKIEMERFLPLSYQSVFKEKYPFISEAVGKALSEFYDELEKR